MSAVKFGFCRYLLVLILLSALSGCQSDSAAGPAAAAAAPEVSVMLAEPVERPLTQSYPGRLAAYRETQVRARAAGILLKRNYVEGQEVAEGELLFSIDDAQLKIDVLSAKSALARAEAEYERSRDDLRRVQSLLGKKAIPEHDYIAAMATEKAGRAEVGSAAAALNRAELLLSYARVTAPISGRAGLAMVSEGALVGQIEPTQLTTIEQLDPIYVDFSQPASDLLAIDSGVKNGRLRKIADADVEVRLKSPDGTFYEHLGRLTFIGSSVDRATDSVPMRAVFPNPDKVLRPGAYLSVSLARAVSPQAFLIPRDSVLWQEGQGRLLALSADGVVEKRQADVGELDGKNWVLTSGLEAGDRVILDGVKSAGLEGRKVTAAVSVPAPAAVSENAPTNK